MPAKSEKQRRFMAAVANNPKFAKKVGVPQSVGEEFMKTKKYQAGGAPMTSIRPKARPKDLMSGVGSSAPRRSLRPRARPEGLEENAMAAGAIARGDRASMREAMDLPPSGMKKGGKVRGYGKARGAKACKMC